MLKTGGRLAALWNEDFLIGSQILNDAVDEIKVILPKGLGILTHNSQSNPTIKKSENSYTFTRSELKNYNLLSLRCVQSLELEVSQLIPIHFIAYCNSEKIFEDVYSVKIIIPNVDVKVSKTQATTNQGFIHLDIISREDIILTVRDIDLIVYQQGTTIEIPVKKEPLSMEKYWELIHQLPDEINPISFIGHLVVPKNIPVDIQVKIKVVDLLNNNYEMRSNILTVNTGEIKHLAANPFNVPNYLEIPAAI